MSFISTRIDRERKESNVKNEQEVLEKEEIPEEQIETEETKEEAETELEAALKKYDELYDKHLRTLAEYDNYKRRTQKEKDEIYASAQIDTIGSLLPVLDNLERAIDTEESSPFKEGVEMIVKQLIDILGKMGVSEIDAVGSVFDPNVHNAVMHVEDENLEANTVAEQFAKGYMLKDKVIRHSMVKVAN